MVETGKTPHVEDVVLPVDGAPHFDHSLRPLQPSATAGILVNPLDPTTGTPPKRAPPPAPIHPPSGTPPGTAIGILMAHRRITDTAAFELLRDASQRGHRKLRDIAEDVVLTGTVPE